MSNQIQQLLDTARGKSLEERLELLTEITQSFALSLDVEEALRTALLRFIEYLHAEGVAIFLLENECRELVCRACEGPVDVTGLRLDVSQGIVGRTVTSRTTQMVRDVRQDPDFYQKADDESGFVTRSILCSPLMVRGECIGALELVNKRGGDGLFDEHDRTLMQALASSAALAIHNARMADGLVEQERLRKELDLAREIQLDLLPRAAARDFSIQAVNLPAQAVSGDFYDFLQLPDGRVYFNLADVSGKGMNAALLMAKASSLLHHLARAETDPGRLLATVNNAICETSSHGMFITIVSGYLNPEKGSVTFANAGHLPPLFHDADGAFHEFPAMVPPLGVLPDSSFPVETLPLRGGCLYLYTDGVTEAEDAAGRPLDTAGLQDTIRAHAGEPLSQRLQAITEAVMHGRRQRDDVTLMLIGCP